jgi:hypothetical protein
VLFKAKSNCKVGVLKKKIKAATLIESIVSMIIIMMVFAMFVITYSNLMSSDGGQQKLKALSMINRIVQETKSARIYTDSTMKQDGLSVIRSMSRSIGSGNVITLTVRVINTKGKVIARHDEIFLK